MRLGRSRLLVAIALVGLAPLAAILATAGWRAYHELDDTVTAKFAGRPWTLPARVYAAAFPIYPGVDLAGTEFAERLRRLGYREVAERVQARGDVWRDPRGAAVDVFLHAFRYPLHPEPGRAIHLDLRDGVVTHVRDLASGEEMPDATLEPEPLAALYEGAWEERRVIPLGEIPPTLIAAVLAVEDRRFYEHGAIDARGVVRALLRNVAAKRIVEGGSTLTQQLMKNFFLSDARTVRRKAKELAMAIIAERRYPKDRILELYLNEIYLGQSGAKGVFGVGEASAFYFGKELGDLSVGETALLAGLIRAPNRYSPFRSPERARARRDTVLALMAQEGVISAEAAAEATAAPVTVRSPVAEGNDAPYFVDFVRRELAATYPPEALTADGLRIFTSLDTQLQAAAEAALRAGLEDLERRHPRLRRAGPDERLEGALVALHPVTGEIKAMVGGRDYRVSQFNRAADARRQPGSVFKPIVYYAALEPADGEAHLLPTTHIEDEPFTWSYDGGDWTPRNYGDRYLGDVTVQRALELSLNAATARVAFAIGLPRVIDAAQRLGFAAPLPRLPSLVLGGLETTPLNIAEVYAVFASQGQRTSSRAVKQVAAEDGALLEGRPLAITNVMSPRVSYLVTRMLEGAIDHGTASAARAAGLRAAVAGKTGTTNDYADAWFAGYTSDLVTVVWVGFDRREPIGLSGAQAALPIWTTFMRRATASQSARDFEVPPGVVEVAVDPQTGMRATLDCPGSTVQAFLEEDAPRVDCPLHAQARVARAPAEPGPADAAAPTAGERPRSLERPWWRRWLGLP